MRKITLALVCAGLMVLSFACSNTEEKTDTANTPPTTTAAAPPSGAPAIDKVSPAPGQPTASAKPAAPGGKTVTLPSGLQYQDIVVGTGPSPKAGQTVMVQYTGTLKDGTKFDSSYDHGGQPIGFPIGVGKVIKGWDEGVITMKVGGKRKLIIPADMGYGAQGTPDGSVPPNATLIFDVELVSIQ